MSLYTFPGYALVKLLPSKYKHIAAQQKVYEAASAGTLIKVSPVDPMDSSFYKIAIDQTVYWEELNAKAPIEYEGEMYAYVKLEDLMGYEYD